MKGIMYHYVRPDFNEYPNFKHLNIELFKKQLDYFEKYKNFIKKEDFLEAIESNKLIDGVYLTFDDGFKDHIDYVLPELDKRGLWGSFYIPTKHYKNSKLLGVHRVHYLIGKYDSKKLMKEVLDLIDNSMLDEEKIKEFDQEIYKGQEGKQSDYMFKRLFNYYIAYKYRDKVLDILMKKYFNENELHDSLYMTKKEILQIETSGSIIGSHTLSHKVLSRLDYKTQYKEIKDSFIWLEEEAGCQLSIRSFCYPYGERSSYNLDTIKILSKLNVHHAVVADEQIQKQPIKRYELSRLDCNRFLNV